jgi:hypothetical protein
VTLIRTDVSEDRIVPVFYESLPIQELTTSLCSCPPSCTLKMEAIRSSETSVRIRATRRHLPEDYNHHINQSSHNSKFL